MEITALHICIPVLQMEESVTFYREVFGLRVAVQNEDLSQLYLGTHLVSLKKTHDGSSSLQRDGANGVRARHFGFRVKNDRELEDAVAVLRSKGAHLVPDSGTPHEGRSVFC